MLEIYQCALPTDQIYAKWEKIAQNHKFGAYCLFCGIVREEEGSLGLSFDLYEPLLYRWFAKWEKIAKEKEMIVCLAHAKGDVFNTQSSYMSAILSSHRRCALELYADFIEDFKHNAPIWKYDLKGNKRVYAKDRSHAIEGSGILVE